MPLITPDLSRRNPRSRMFSVMQRYVVIAADGAAISTHRSLRVALEGYRRYERGGFIWDRIAMKVVEGVADEGLNVRAPTRFERIVADEMEPEGSAC